MLFPIKEEINKNNLNNISNDNKLLDNNILNNIDKTNINNNQNEDAYLNEKDNDKSNSSNYNSSNIVINNINEEEINIDNYNSNYIIKNIESQNEFEINNNKNNQRLQLKIENENNNLFNNNTKKNNKYSAINFEKNFENEMNNLLEFSFSNINEKRKKINPLKNILLFYPIFSSNNILGTDDKKNIINIKVNFDDLYDDEDNIQINEFPVGGAYCNYKRYLYFTGGQEKNKDIGKLFFVTGISNENNDIVMDKLNYMNNSHWNHSMIINNKNSIVIKKRLFLNNLEKNTCIICHDSRGYLIKCNKDDCTNYFHIECAREQNYFLEYKYNKNFEYSIFCGIHSNCMCISSNNIKNINNNITDEVINFYKICSPLYNKIKHKNNRHNRSTIEELKKNLKYRNCEFITLICIYCWLYGLEIIRVIAVRNY